MSSSKDSKVSLVDIEGLEPAKLVDATGIFSTMCSRYETKACARPCEGVLTDNKGNR